MPLGFDESFDVVTIAFCHTVGVAPRKEVRISTRKYYSIKGLKSGAGPLLMSLFFKPVRPIRGARALAAAGYPAPPDIRSFW